MRSLLAHVAVATLVIAGSFVVSQASGATPPPGYPVTGIDVSKWQGTVDWTKVAASAKFAYVKATEGTTYLSNTFAVQYTGAKTAGLLTGAYAFARPDAPALAQADYFVDNMKFATDGKTLPPMLDIEWPYTGSNGQYVAPYPCYGLTPADMVTWIRTFTNEVKRRTGQKMMIYTANNWWSPCTGNTTAFSDLYLDVAYFASTPPATIPSSWPAWDFWQYSSSGALPGDQDVFRGTLAELQALAPKKKGCPGVAGDINADGYADIVAGAPRRAVAGHANAGAAAVVYGTAAGLNSANSVYLDQNSNGVLGSPTAQAQLGAAVVTGDFNGDCHADTAIGAPGKTTGLVSILYGDSTGLTAATSQILHDSGTPDLTQRVPVSGIATALSSRFGAALASGDFNDDGYADLAVGAPDADNGAGKVGVVYGKPGGLSRSITWFHPGVGGLAGLSAQGAHFGVALAVGDFTGDGNDDLAVGSPGDRVGGVAGAGTVTVLPGSGAGLTAVGSSELSQNSSGVPGSAAANAAFGSALATGDVNGDGRCDLAVGMPGASSGAGAVVMLPGAPGGVTSSGSSLWSQSTSGVAGSTVSGDAFGTSVAMGDINGDGRADLVVGVPGKDVGTVKDGGAFEVLYAKGSGLTATSSIQWSQNSSGVPGSAVKSGRFGSSVRVANVESGYADVIVGAPGGTGVLTQLRGAASGVLASGGTSVTISSLNNAGFTTAMY